MQGLIERHDVTLDTIGITFTINVPVGLQEVALRVECKYEPNQTPPAPVVVIIGINWNPPQAQFAHLPARFFSLWPQGMQLPDNFLKYVGTVPFGAGKTPVDILELSS